MSTGRYYVIDSATGRKFCVEPISARDEKTTDRVITNGGFDGESVKNKSQVEGGSVHEAESIITEENGFRDVTTLRAGVNPNGYIAYLCHTGRKVGQ